MFSVVHTTIFQYHFPFWSNQQTLGYFILSSLVVTQKESILTLMVNQIRHQLLPSAQKGLTMLHGYK